METALKQYPAFSLAGEVQDSQSLLEFIKKQAADMVLLDGDLPGIPMQELIGKLHGQNPGLIVVAMCRKAEEGRFLLGAGADCLVSKGDSPEWLVEQLKKYTN